MSDSGNKSRSSFSLRLFWMVFSIFLGFCFCFILFQYQRERVLTEMKLDAVLSNYNYQLHSKSSGSESFSLVVGQFVDEIPEKELRVTIISPQGEVLYDNSGSADFDNHYDRSEIHKALINGEGYAIRTSGTTGQKYFYSARYIGDYVFRTALPYDDYVQDYLSVNKEFVYFMVLMILVFFFVLSRFTFSIGKTISRLSDFSGKVEKGELPETDYTFPEDELGDIAKNMVSLYLRQQKVKEEELKMRQQLTQNVAHELKTPVSSIQGYLETIISNPALDEEKKAYFIEKCYLQSTRLTELLQDISLLNRLDEAREMFDLSIVSINLLLQEIENECARVMEDKRIKTEISLPEQVEIYGNRSLLYSIFRNLYDNAIAYAGEGCRIRIECRAESLEYWCFHFSDNGIGIAEEHLKRIFERFYRIDKGRSRKMGGTGLGLSIVKNGVLFHKGQIKVESRLGQGVRFSFTLQKHL